MNKNVKIFIGETEVTFERDPAQDAGSLYLRRGNSAWAFPLDTLSPTHVTYRLEAELTAAVGLYQYQIERDRRIYRTGWLEVINTEGAVC